MKKHDQVEPGEPKLPLGLDFEEETLSAEQESLAPPGVLSGLAGFWDIRAGLRTQNDPFQKDASLGEIRLQLETQKNLNNLLVNLTCDFVYDPVFDHHSIYLEEGQGFVDLRETNILFSPVEFMDIKLGRMMNCDFLKTSGDTNWLPMVTMVSGKVRLVRILFPVGQSFRAFRYTVQVFGVS